MAVSTKPQSHSELIGIVSDTHGLLRPEVLPALRGVTHILHAGDVGDAAVLDQLRTIAPVTAVRGNVDVSGVVGALPLTEAVELAGRLFYVVHRIQDLDLNAAAAGISVVVSGHTHKMTSKSKDGVLYLNPGSIGPRRFRLPVTLVRLRLGADSIVPEWVTLG